MFHKHYNKYVTATDTELTLKLGRRFYKSITRAFGSTATEKVVNSVDYRKRNALFLFFNDDYIDKVKRIEFIDSWIARAPPSVCALLDQHSKRDSFNILRRACGYKYSISPDEFDDDTLYRMSKSQFIWHTVQQKVWPGKEKPTESEIKAKMAEYIALNAFCTYLLAMDRDAMVAEVVQQLIYLRIDTTHKDENGNDCLDYVCRSQFYSDEAKLNVIRTLLHHKVPLNFERNHGVLFKILNVQRELTESTLELIELLVQNRIRVDHCNEPGETPLWVFCKNYGEGVYSDTRLFFRGVRILLTPNSVQLAPKNRSPPLLEILDNKKFYKEFDKQIDWGSDGEVDEEDEYEEKTLSHFIGLFLARGFNADARDRKDRTALMKICAHCKAMYMVDAVLLLLHKGADATLVDVDGNNALMHLMSRKQCPNVAILVTRILIASGLSPVAVNSLGQNALMLACATNQNGRQLYAIVQYLCEHGVSPKTKCSDEAAVNSGSWNDAAGVLKSNLAASVIRMNAGLLDLLEEYAIEHEPVAWPEIQEAKSIEVQTATPTGQETAETDDEFRSLLDFTGEGSAVCIDDWSSIPEEESDDMVID